MSAAAPLSGEERAAIALGRLEPVEPATRAPGPSTPPAADPWPTLDPAALYGLAGEVVAAIGPHTEADPAGLLLDLLVSFGNAVGSGPHATADGSLHPGRLFAVLVGETSRARKGTTRANGRRVFEHADPGWSDTRVMGGLASGEGLIAALADPDEKGEGGTTDKRLLVVEPEFARTLGVAARESSTLSAVIRDAWDSGRLRVMTRKDPLVATGAHVSLLGHVTLDELRRRLSDSEAANGFMNRFLIACVRRSKLLPEGGNLGVDTYRSLGRQVGTALERARRVGLVARTPDAAERWARIYAELAENDPGGLVGAVTARAEAQCLRLSVVFALLDGSALITVEHLDAAYAVWQFCADSAGYIFGDALGDEIADRLLAALRSAGPEGLDGTAQRDLFARHVSGARLDAARALLVSLGLAEMSQVDTGGRPRSITVATEALKAPKGRSA